MSYGTRFTISTLQTALDTPLLVFFAPVGTCSLRPSLAATLRAAIAVQIVCSDDLSLNRSYGYAFGRRHPLAHKFVRNRFGRPKVACRVCAMEGAHQKIRCNHRITW